LSWVANTTREVASLHGIVNRVDCPPPTANPYHVPIMICSFDRQLFDRHLDRVMSSLPQRIHAMLEEVPLIVEDEPSRELLEDLGLDPRHDDLCGLHSGIPLTERSVAALPSVPDQIMVFRGPILRMARSAVPGTGRATVAEMERQIRITVLHEVGHHFGLDEDDLAALGYA